MMSMKKYGWVIIATIIIAALMLVLVLYPRDFQHYFFFQDSGFLSGSDSTLVKWKPFGWNFSYPFNYNVDFGNGNVTLFYNESSGANWGGAVVLAS